jgi:hypothetical protein
MSTNHKPAIWNKAPRLLQVWGCCQQRNHSPASCVHVVARFALGDRDVSRGENIQLFTNNTERFDQLINFRGKISSYSRLKPCPPNPS